MSQQAKSLTLMFLLVLALPVILARPAWSGTKLEATPPVYGFVIENSWLTIKDGVRLSVTFFKPEPTSPNEKLPVLFEFLPYRKGDSFYQRDYPLYTYFARRGFIMAKVDIRGTGSSEGLLPAREYSEQELDDAVEIIDQLSRLPGSNGRVGMWGISWGGFNAIQVAMRWPPGSGFHGKASHRLELNGRTLGLFTTLDVVSDEKYFHVIFKREIFENDKLVRRREWPETVPRRFQ